MAKRMRKAVSLGAKLAAQAKNKLKKQLNALLKAGIIDRTEVRKILSYAIKEAREEKERIKTFVKTELKRQAKKGKPLLKRAVRRAGNAIKRRLKSRHHRRKR
ncbi:MAG TPA: hypothetical protein VI612_04605 [Candidatus Nanoarchaeia archaeon]|nr:hypothetical protein [Candidatus Nanoarchaeia archaeon]